MAQLRYWIFTIATVITFFVVISTWVLASLFIPPMKKVYSGPVGWFYKFFIDSIKVSNLKTIHPTIFIEINTFIREVKIFTCWSFWWKVKPLLMYELLLVITFMPNLSR